MKSKIALTSMLNAFPQSGGDIELRLRTFEAALREIPDDAIIDACAQYVRGEVKEQDTRFAPSVAEFCNTARQCDAIATHKAWLRNRESIQPLPGNTARRPVRASTQAIIDSYRANYQEKLKTRPDLAYVDSIREDYKAATGKILPFKNPRTKEQIAAEQSAHEERHFGHQYRTAPRPHSEVAE